MRKPALPPPHAPRVFALVDAGQIIRAKRRALALRIDEAADFSAVSVDLLSRLENGKTGVSTVGLLKVLDALGLAMLIVDKRELPPGSTPFVSTPSGAEQTLPP